jgi:hypothetical protein
VSGESGSALPDLSYYQSMETKDSAPVAICPVCTRTVHIFKIAGEEPWEASCKCRYATGGTKTAALANWKAGQR